MSADSNIAGRMERLPLGRFHYLAFLLIGVAMLFDGYDLTITGFVLPPLKQIGWMAGSNTAWFISLPLLAAALGSVAAGAIGDRVGRRRLFFVNVLIYSFGSLACGLAQNYDMLLAARTVTLFGLGMQIVTGYSYMNELTPAKWRGGFQSAVAMAVNGGLPIGAILAAVLVPSFDIALGWRGLFLVSVVPAALLLVGQDVLPESPRWLSSRGRDAEADAIVARIEAGFGGPSVLPPPEKLPAPAQNLGWASLFQGGVRRRFFLAVVFQICHLSSIFVLVSWLPSIMVARGLSMGNTFTFTAVSFAGGALGPLIAIFVADRLERRWTVAFAALVGAVSGLLYALQTTPIGLMAVGLVLVTAIYYISAVGFATYVPELLPTGVRLRGLGTSALIGRLASAGTPFVVAAVLAGTSNPLIVVTGVGCLYVILAVSIAIFGPNTAGRSLESLERSGLDGSRPMAAKAFP